MIMFFDNMNTRKVLKAAPPWSGHDSGWERHARLAFVYATKQLAKRERGSKK
jgi:hypothetical protein